MNALSLAGGPFADDLFPFSLTRSVADIRCGILTIREKWECYFKKHPLPSGLSIPANMIPRVELVRALLENDMKVLDNWNHKLNDCTDILRLNPQEIQHDFDLITSGRRSASISSTNKISGTDIFLENGAIAEHCYFNASEGPIYIGKDALVMEGTMIRGPFALGEKSVVKMGTKIYGASSAGPYSILGGEIKNSVIFGYSNKAHDGYLGDSVIGEWCNLGAGSSNSNIKNSGGEVKYWNGANKKFVNAGMKFGILMGDYSRSAINTSFNTGTVTGVCCHVFGTGPTPAYLPSFSWGFKPDPYAFDKAIQHIDIWKNMKGHKLETPEKNLLKSIFDQQNQQK
jgi:UDP-N-acetylglucosamine diphosphorylase / glucose-1-phosphate thymidylyltransferase / UDP-N-acetylgalactosamine diphosphorylase / glucosamine-1-phosphate N-acetyltransferase / galactosamine-1-phosphate N-acetyltransferase